MGKEQGYFTNYPFHVFLILLSEFCERFSYYGMRAVLVLFLWKGLEFSEESSTIIYHTFVILCYATPILGAIIADGWLGKYRTILYLSIIYSCGSLMMTAGAIPYNGSYIKWLPILALVIIAFGTGGIKPCVSSFGGDQYAPEQERQKDSFFSIFYFTINVGSLISTIVIPYIRGNVYCFGDTCYSLCFGIPAILMIISIVVFVLGTRWYTIFPPGESILQRMGGCIGKALSRKCSCNKDKETEKKEHWLDYAAPEYDQPFIEDVKDVLRVSWLFIPLPIFWALYDQQGSRWTFQAQQMNGEMGSIVVLPDQIAFLNPFLVVLIIPLLESLIYPCLDKIKILNRPLQKMVFGMTLAGVAFLVAGFLQIGIDGSQPATIEAGKSKVQFLNVASCSSANVNISDQMYTVNKLEATEYDYLTSSTYEITFDCNGTRKENFTFESTKAYQIYIADGILSMNEQDNLLRTDKGESQARIFNALNTQTDVRLVPDGLDVDPYDFLALQVDAVSDSQRLIYATFAVWIRQNSSADWQKLSSEIKTKNGPVYSLLLTQENEVTMTQIEEIGPWTINIFLQTPQYLIMTIAELFFSPIGLGFSYSQAPASMKSILSAIWLLTVCFGNIIIIIVVAVASSGSISAAGEFFLFAGLMFATTIIYAIMCVFYRYSVPRDQQFEETESVSTLSHEKRPDETKSVSSLSHDNDAFDADEGAKKSGDAKTSLSQTSVESKDKDSKDSGRGGTPASQPELESKAHESSQF